MVTIYVAGGAASGGGIGETRAETRETFARFRRDQRVDGERVGIDGGWGRGGARGGEETVSDAGTGVGARVGSRGGWEGGGCRFRAVLHRDLSQEDVERGVERIRTVIEGAA